MGKGGNGALVDKKKKTKESYPKPLTHNNPLSATRNDNVLLLEARYSFAEFPTPSVIYGRYLFFSIYIQSNLY